jgi:S1-C subfamily serine protease
LIIELDGHTVQSVDDLHSLLTEERIGAACEMTVVREQELRVLGITPREPAE